MGQKGKEGRKGRSVISISFNLKEAALPKIVEVANYMNASPDGTLADMSNAEVHQWLSKYARDSVAKMVQRSYRQMKNQEIEEPDL